MKVRNLLLIGLTSVMAWSCSDDELQGGGNNKPASSKNYIEVSIKMPTTTRTATPNEGTEVGLDFENQVNSVLILAVEAKGTEGEEFTEEGALRLARKVGSDQLMTEAGEQPIVTLQDVKLDIEQGYTIYAFVNPTDDMVDHYLAMVDKGSPWDKEGAVAFAEGAATPAITSADAHGFIESLTYDGYAANFSGQAGATSAPDVNKGNFLMTDTKTTSSNREGKKEIYRFKNTGNEVYKLSASTNVERAVARFDYKANDNGNEYEIKDGEGTTDKPVSGKTLTVTLAGYKIMNISKTFYHLKRVVAKASDSNYNYGGAETATNYVVDADWDAKNKWTGKDENELDIRKKLFFVPLNGEDKSDYISLGGLFDDNHEDTGGPGQNWDGNDEDDVNKNGYKVLGYCTENTIKGNSNQRYGLTTAVVFKAEIGGSIIEEGTSALYRYNNTVYNTWDAVYSAYRLNNPSASYNNYEAYKTACNAEGKALEITRWKKDTTDGKFYCYYAYWNRHNDNGKSTVMGPMEFAVVRNNIYKLDIKNIWKLGHPTDPTNPIDPDEPWKPTTPDEEDKLTMDVNVSVLNWAVRVNNITFE